MYFSNNLNKVNYSRSSINRSSNYPEQWGTQGGLGVASASPNFWGGNPKLKIFGHLTSYYILILLCFIVE